MVSATNSGKVYKGFPVMFNPGNNDFPIKDQNGKVIGIRRFVPEDALYEKLSHILKTNDYKIGVLLFIFPDMPYDIIKQEATILSLQFGDIRNKSSAIYQISIKELIKKSEPITLPSLKYPFLLDPKTH